MGKPSVSTKIAAGREKTKSAGQGASRGEDSCLIA
jgi:hypothetical protein